MAFKDLFKRKVKNGKEDKRDSDDVKIKKLKDILNTERDKKELEEKSTEITYTSELYIKLKDGFKLEWVVTGLKNKYPLVIPSWKPFYKWYFSRPQSSQFRLIGKESETLIKREEISFFQIVNKPEV